MQITGQYLQTDIFPLYLHGRTSIKYLMLRVVLEELGEIVIIIPRVLYTYVSFEYHILPYEVVHFFYAFRNLNFINKLSRLNFTI